MFESGNNRESVLSKLKRLKNSLEICQKEKSDLQQKLLDPFLTPEEYDEISNQIAIYDGEINQKKQLIRHFMEK
jgi:Trp operon repressor